MKRSSSTTVEKWRPLIREQEGSGLSVQAFCAKHGHVAHQFRYWKQKVRASRLEPRLVPIVAKRTVGAVRPVTADGLTLELGKARIGVRSGFDRHLLRELLEVLGGGQ